MTVAIQRRGGDVGPTLKRSGQVARSSFGVVRPCSSPHPMRHPSRHRPLLSRDERPQDPTREFSDAMPETRGGVAALYIAATWISSPLLTAVSHKLHADVSRS